MVCMWKSSSGEVKLKTMVYLMGNIKQVRLDWIRLILIYNSGLVQCTQQYRVVYPVHEERAPDWAQGMNCNIFLVFISNQLGGSLESGQRRVLPQPCAHTRISSREQGHWHSDSNFQHQWTRIWEGKYHRQYVKLIDIIGYLWPENCRTEITNQRISDDQTECNRWKWNEGSSCLQWRYN